MKRHFVVVAAAALILGPFSAQAAEQTVALAVHHADCALCAPIVKGTLEKVKGVKIVSVSQPNDMADVTAKVTFDDSATNVPKLIAATTKAGYPADVAR
jgi:mercuric ion binding protein